MRYKLLTVCAASLILTACAGYRSGEDRTINEPAGAYATNQMSMPTTPARNIYQRPYPGVDPNYDEWKETSPRAPGGMPTINPTVPDETLNKDTDEP